MSAFWNFVTSLVPGTLAKAEDVNTNLSGIGTGLDLVETEIDQALQVTNAAGVTDIVLNASARANKLLAFDASGDISATQILGVWKGAHANAAGTDYQVRDVVRDDAGSIQLGSLYICNNTHTSTGSILTDTANWDILVDATDLTTLGGFTSAQFLRSDVNDSFTAATLTVEQDINIGASADASPNVIIDSAAAGNPVLRFQHASTDQAIIQCTAAGGLIIETQGADPIVLEVNNAETLSLTTTEVEVAGSFMISDSIGDNHLQMLAGPLSAQINYAVANDFRLQVNSSTVITMDSSQNVTFAGDIDVGGGQIKFPATANPSADANTLDDYEEGTWTPTIQDTSLSDAESQTYSTQSGEYTKIGRVVHVRFTVQFSSLGSLTVGDQAYIAGLPFNPASENIFAIQGTNLNITAGESVTANTLAGVSYFGLNVWDDAAGITGMVISEISGDGRLAGSGTYFI